MTFNEKINAFYYENKDNHFYSIIDILHKTNTVKNDKDIDEKLYELIKKLEHQIYSDEIGNKISQIFEYLPIHYTDFFIIFIFNKNRKFSEKLISYIQKNLPILSNDLKKFEATRNKSRIFNSHRLELLETILKDTYETTTKDN
jgi:hypothetical protein